MPPEISEPQGYYYYYYYYVKKEHESAQNKRSNTKAKSCDTMKAEGVRKVKTI